MCVFRDYSRNSLSDDPTISLSCFQRKKRIVWVLLIFWHHSILVVVRISVRGVTSNSLVQQKFDRHLMTRVLKLPLHRPRYYFHCCCCFRLHGTSVVGAPNATLLQMHLWTMPMISPISFVVVVDVPPSPLGVRALWMLGPFNRLCAVLAFFLFDSVV